MVAFGKNVGLRQLCIVLFWGGLGRRVSSSADTLLIPEVKREWPHNFEMTGR